MRLDCGGFTACRPYAGIRAHAAGPVLLARDFGPPRPDPAHLCGRSFAKTRIGWSIGNRRSVFGRPPRRRRAANCRRCRQPTVNMTLPLRSIELPTHRATYLIGRRCRQPARRPPSTPPEPEQIQPPQRCQQAPSRGSPKRIVRRGSGRRLGRLAFVAGERALQLPRLGEDTGAARRLWAGACRRGTGVTGGVRVQPTLLSARATRAVPRRGLGAMSQPSQLWGHSSRTATRRLGGDGYSRGCRSPPHPSRRRGSRRGKAPEERPPGMPDAHPRSGPRPRPAGSAMWMSWPER